MQVEGRHSIDLEDFVAYEEIDPVFFAHSYLVGPQDGAEKTYALLVRAMEKSGLVGIGKFVMRNRQYLGCLRVRDRTLTLEQMHFADEIDAPSGVVPSKLPSVGKSEIDMALSLIEGFCSSNGSRSSVDGMSKKQLDELARELEIPGRSKMSRDELAEAVQAAR